MTKSTLLPSVLLAAAIAMLAIVLLTKPLDTVVGSVERASEYHGTTTSQGRFLTDVVLLDNDGTLGSVVITGAAAGVINLYDATTTDPAQREASMSSSSILVATIPASAAAGTYVFDRVLRYGLVANITGTIPTTTITFRP